jgi:hypothetical protein
MSRLSTTESPLDGLNSTFNFEVSSIKEKGNYYLEEVLILERKHNITFSKYSFIFQKGLQEIPSVMNHMN